MPAYQMMKERKMSPITNFGNIALKTNDRDEALRLARESEIYYHIWPTNGSGKSTADLILSFYQLCRDKFAGKGGVPERMVIVNEQLFQQALSYLTPAQLVLAGGGIPTNAALAAAPALASEDAFTEEQEKVKRYLNTIPKFIPTESATPETDALRINKTWDGRQVEVSHVSIQKYEILERQHNELRERVKELKKDAARYQWMRRWWDEDEAITFKDGIPAAKELDAAIDAAIAKEDTNP